jgi:hypothetical protein
VDGAEPAAGVARLTGRAARALARRRPRPVRRASAGVARAVEVGASLAAQRAAHRAEAARAAARTAALRRWRRPSDVARSWRGDVARARRAYRSFVATLEGTPPGPLRDRLEEVDVRLREAFDRCGEAAERGTDLERRLRSLRALAPPTPLFGGLLGAEAEAARRSRAAVGRLDRLLARARGHLRDHSLGMVEVATQALDLVVRDEPAEGVAVERRLDEVVAGLLALQDGLDRLAAEHAPIGTATGEG